uniref:Major facilitator superfamily (MFS) profile domain-containing protein n=1 Tax=Fagus sylvatica TaxID=28930 RepID=A0A2N9GB94_FAGSY
MKLILATPFGGKSRVASGLRWGRVAVVLFGLHSITYICGMKTAPAIVNVEILSFAYRGVGESLSAIATSMATLVVSLMFSPIQNSLGSSSIFFLNAGFALFGVILLYFILPETNGVRLERMDNGIQLAIIDNVMPEEHPQNEDMGLQEGPQNEDPELPMLLG